MIVIGVALGMGALSLMYLTGLGEHRRGASTGVVALAAIFFPITWVAWYAKDDLPGRRNVHRVG